MCIRDRVNIGGGHAGELDLGLLGSFLQALHGDLVAGEIHAVGALEDVYKRQVHKLFTLGTIDNGKPRWYTAFSTRGKGVLKLRKERDVWI